MGRNKIFWVFVVLALIYLTLNFIIPPEEAALARYKITADEIRILRLTLALPIVVIWFIALYGYLKIRDYAIAVAKSPEGLAFNKIARGLLILALWLPITGIVGNLVSYIVNNNSDYEAAATILRNYINVAIVLLALYILCEGTRLLIRQSKKIRTPNYSAVNVVFVVMSVFFVYWTLTNPDRQFPPDESSVAAYYLPDWLLIPSIIIPYLAAFYFGMIAVQNILIYRFKVKGLLYKKALASLASGLSVIILSIIGLRYLSAFTEFLNEATLKIILLVIYCLIFFIAVGYGLIALGTKRLQKIEGA